MLLIHAERPGGVGALDLEAGVEDGVVLFEAVEVDLDLARTRSPYLPSGRTAAMRRMIAKRGAVPVSVSLKRTL